MTAFQTLSKAQWEGRTHGGETSNSMFPTSQMLAQRLSHDETLKQKKWKKSQKKSKQKEQAWSWSAFCFWSSRLLAWKLLLPSILKKLEKKAKQSKNQQFFLESARNWGQRANHCLSPNWRDRQAYTENHRSLEHKPNSRNFHRNQYGARKI